MAGVLAAVFGVLSGIMLLLALLNFWWWRRARRRRTYFWLGLFAVVQMVVLLTGAVVVERPAGPLYGHALFLRSALLGVSAVLSVTTLSRLLPTLRAKPVAAGLAVITVVRTVLWATTDVLVKHPVNPNRWPAYGPASATGLLYAAGVLFVAARALRPADPVARRVLWFTIVTTLAGGAVPAFVSQGFLFDVCITFSAVPACVGILYLGARTIARTASARDRLVQRQAVLTELGRVTYPTPSADWIRRRAEYLLSAEFGPTTSVRIDDRWAPDGGSTDADTDTTGTGAPAEHLRALGRRCQVSATVTGLAGPTDRRYVESVVQLVAAATDRSAAEAEIAFGTTHDQLTGLPNRLLLVDRLEGLLSEASPGPTLVVLCRLDGLDAVVAVAGHDAADATTLAVADALALLVAPPGYLARMSTHVFALVYQLPPDDEVPASLGRRLDVLTATLRAVLTGPAVRAAIGAVVSSDGGTVKTLLRDAAAAVGRATPGGPPEIFDVELGIRARAQAQLVDDLGQAVARHEIEVHYQPIVDVRTREVRSYEALARWRRDGHLLPPAQWIPIAEQSGLIDGIGLHVLELACRVQRRLGVPVAVNVSALQVMGDRFAEQVVCRLGDCPPDQLVLEVTESVVMPDVDTAVRVFTELRELGIRTALDDFGTSYSSLSVLAALPVDVLKIDRSFVQALSSSTGPSVVTSIVSLAHALGKTTVAEGVETEQQFGALAALGVDRIQGYLVGRPAPLEAQVALH